MEVWTFFLGVFKSAWEWITRSDIYAKLEKCDTDRDALRTELGIVRADLVSTNAVLDACRELLLIGTMATDQSGRICEASPETCKMSGYTERQLLGMSVSELLPYSFRVEHGKLFKDLVAGVRTVRTTLVEGEIRKANGGSALVLVKITEIPSGSGTRYRADLIRRQ